MKKILIYNSGGGLGDSIQLFTLILSIQYYYKESTIYYLSAHEDHFSNKLKEFNIKIISLKLGLKYFGFRVWHYFFVKKNFIKINIDKFDLIIDTQSKIRNTLILKKIPHKLFFSSAFNYKFSSIKKNFNSNHLIENLENFLDIRLEKKKFNVNTLNKNLLLEAKKLLPENNYLGLSLTQGNKYRKKSWNTDNFVLLAKEIIKKNKKPVFFIKDKELISELNNRIPEAIFPEKKTEYSCPALVTALGTRLDKAVTIDNGIMHMLSLAKVPMIILFGPTNSEKFAPGYEGIKILDSKKMYNSKDINLITVNDVLKEI